MARNLRDSGYPSAKSYVPNRSDKRNTNMNGSVDYFPYRGSQGITEGYEPVERRDALDKLITAYNNRAFGNPSAPLLSRGGIDYVDDNTDSRAYDSNLALWAKSGDRLGFAGRNVVDGGPSMYSAGIDNLPFGERYVNKEIATPLGTFGAEYDGDGTAALSYETSPYIQALANLLRR